jgi:hypothetical protein
MDFTLNTYITLLNSLLRQGFSFQRFDQYLTNPLQKSIILRHDVDLLPENSTRTAQIENSVGISGTYYFRAVPESWDELIMKKIASLGHEIGYHYECLTTCKGNYEEAINDFEQNLAHFRALVPVTTICMHGSPLSKYDSRLLWDNYNYREFSIIGEPYFDIDFSEVLYLTDTGRRWDGDKFSIRDKPRLRDEETKIGKDEEGENRRKGEEVNGNKIGILKFHSTFDIIKAANESKLPDKIIITVHPQRWTDQPIPWAKELIMQNIKNIVKRYFFVR